MDQRLLRAQLLQWEIEALERLGAHHAEIRSRQREGARIREERARELLAASDVQGFIDLFAAVTLWTDSGDRTRALSLLDLGAQHAAGLVSGRDNVQRQLDELWHWVDERIVVPSLSAFDRKLPPLPKLAA